MNVPERLEPFIKFLLSPLILVSVGVALVVWLAWFFLTPGVEVEVATARLDIARQAVYGRVTVEPVNQVIVRTRINGEIEKTFVEVGARVKRGDKLIQVGSEGIRFQVKQAEAALKAAKERVKIGPPSMAELKDTEIELDRVKRLFSQEVISKVELERVKSKLADFQRRVEREQINLQEDLRLAKDNLADVESRVRQGIIKSPLDGVVLEKYAELGETVVAQTQIYKIGSEALHLRALINEDDVGSLQRGMPAEVKLSSHATSVFKAKVDEILPDGDNQSYSVILQLDNPPSILLPNMTGELLIIVGEQKDVLIIPSRAIRKGRVYKLEGNRVRVVKVNKGFKSIERTQVTEGLQAGDRVILNEQDKLSDGQWVTPKEVSF